MSEGKAMRDQFVVCHDELVARRVDLVCGDECRMFRRKIRPIKF